MVAQHGDAARDRDAHEDVEEQDRPDQGRKPLDAVPQRDRQDEGRSGNDPHVTKPRELLAELR